MGNGTSSVVGCFALYGKNSTDLDFLEPLDEGLGHSFCYVRPPIFDSPAITPSNSERYTVDSSTLDSETLSGSFRHETVDDPSGTQRKAFPETTFRAISGASVSANVSTAGTGNQNALCGSEVQEPAASFQSTASFAAIPLQPVPRGSGPLNSFLSGPLERGFASGPLDKGGGFMSGPIERKVMSGPLDAPDKSNFSAPLSHGRRRPRFHRLVRSVSGPMRNTLSRTFSKRAMASGWMRRLFLHPATQLAWHARESKFRAEASGNSAEGGLSVGEYVISRNLQWAHGKAGEDRVHVVLSEEQGWLFIGIYDGFSGPDAPDFLMSHLYKAIDKELEGLLWDYEDKSMNDAKKPEQAKCGNSETVSDCSKERQLNSSQVVSHGFEELSKRGTLWDRSSDCDVIEESNDLRSCGKQSAPCEMPSISGSASASIPSAKLDWQGRKSVRLYELLQMESPDELRFSPLSEVENQRNSRSCQPDFSTLGQKSQEQLQSCSLEKCKGDVCDHQCDDPATSGEDGGVKVESGHRRVLSDLSLSLRRWSTRKSLLSSKIRKLYRKQKSLRKKFFPWSYDWHREDASADEIQVEPSGPIRRCKSGTVDHDAVLRAMAHALKHTEQAYMEMVEMALDKNPELALMGSCVLVMLMKDQDVYVMSLGDSRAILAQERLNDCHSNPTSGKDDLRHRDRSRESLVRMELDRISEESPMHNQNSQVNIINKNREISLCRSRMRALQLSTDHSTSIEEEVHRIQAEHPDDKQAILNDRVKGQLKVTRAFGAPFLKKPICNEALLEMFKIDYVGSRPYVSCIPSVLHHRLSSSDQFLVLSSDGLYQYLSNEEVVAHVTWFMENVPEGDPAQYLIAELLLRAAKKNGMDFHELLDIPHGDRRKYHDDVSVMVVSLEGRIWRSSG